MTKTKLTEMQTLILWALLAKGGEGFQKNIKPEAKKADRKALEREGLITCETRGRYRSIWFEASDKGWAWAAENLNADLPNRSTAGSAVLQAWLTRIQAALLIFRLVKSVGRLPNVVYLLIYDRVLAEKIVAERFPSEGSHFLEKIIQAPFELPEPHHSDLCQVLLMQISEICGSPEEDDIVRFMNVFYDVVAPELKTPRDLRRLTNMLSVTWPAVK